MSLCELIKKQRRLCARKKLSLRSVRWFLQDLLFTVTAGELVSLSLEGRVGAQGGLIT